MHAVEQEDAFAERVEHFSKGGAVGTASGAGAFQPLENTHFVTVGLQAPDEPRAAVGQGLVVEVGRILRGHQEPQPEGACLLEEQEQRAFGRRVRYRRKVAEDLVHVEQRAERGRAGLAPHPRDDFLEQGRDEKHPLGIREVGDAQDREARFALRRVEEFCDVERFALAPCGESRRGQEVVERHDQLHALFGRVEIFQRQHADFVEGRVLHCGDQRREVGGLPAFPRILQDRREQAELAAAQRIGIDAEQAEQARRRALHAFGQQLRIIRDTGAWRIERTQDREGDARVAARRVDRDIGLFAQRGDALRGLAPLRETFRPLLRFLRAEFLRGHAGFARILLADPRGEIASSHLRECQEQVSQVAFRVDNERGDAVHGGLLEKRDAQPRLAAAGHADAHTVRGQVARVVEQEVVRRFAIGADFAAEVKLTEFLVDVRGHGRKEKPKFRNLKAETAPACGCYLQRLRAC